MIMEKKMATTIVYILGLYQVQDAAAVGWCSCQFLPEPSNLFKCCCGRTLLAFHPWRPASPGFAEIVEV